MLRRSRARLAGAAAAVLVGLATCAAVVPTSGATSAPSAAHEPHPTARRDVNHHLGGPNPNGVAFAKKSGPTGPNRPNIVLVLTDDMTYTDLRYMPITKRVLKEQGTSFTHAISPDPLCCPARAAILTGQFGQNNGVKGNDAPYDYVALHPGTALPVWLHRAKYTTAFTGKYLNGYGVGGTRQPGWDYWDPTVYGQYNYQNYKMYQNGHPKVYRNAQPNNTDYINYRVNKLVDAAAKQHKPFFIWASQVSPHGLVTDNGDGTHTSHYEPIPPVRFQDKLLDENSPSFDDPSFDEADVSDKSPFVKSMVPFSRDKVNEVFHKRIESLQAVDEGVGQLVDHLRKDGVLDNTYIVFTSDNGFEMGEHRLLTKNVPYTASTHVPLIIRGPNIPKNAVSDERALMIDLAPTFAKIANAKPAVKLDGVNLLPSIRRAEPLRRTVLIQAGPSPKQGTPGPDEWWWRGVTDDRYTYARYLGDQYVELYDHQYDPYELQNVASNPAYAMIVQKLEHETEVLGACAGVADCTRTFDPLPEPLFTATDLPPSPGRPTPASPLPGQLPHDQGDTGDAD